MPTHQWQTSSYCQEGDACVNVASDPTGTVELTESSDPTGAILRTTPEAFAALLRDAKRARGR